MYSDSAPYLYGRSPLGEYYACKVKGASHERSGTPCQDAYAAAMSVVEDEAVVFLAVADGHGSEKYDLSQHGSRLAAKAALDVMKELYDRFSAFPVELARSFRQDLPRLVVRKWREEVESDASLREIEAPNTHEERKALYSRYGTTLLAALCTPRLRLFGQIGDGDMLLIGSDGQADAPLYSASNEQIGNATYSLCSDDAHLLWTTAQRSVPDDGPSLLLLCTDGLTNCFGDDASFRQFAGSLFSHFQTESVYRFSKSLPDVFKDYSERGSGDDITVSVLFHAPGNPEASPKNEEEEEDSRAADRTEA